MENFNNFKLRKMYFCVFRKLSTAFFAFTAMTAAVSSCTLYSSKDREIEVTAEEFGNHFFNYELKEAAAMVTDDSRKWIVLLASNVDSATVAMIRNQDEAATVSVDNLSILSDTTAAVELIADNIVWAHDIEGTPEVKDGQSFSFHMVKHNGKWLVRMDSLLQSGK